MAAWWGLAGLIGLLGIYGLTRARRLRSEGRGLHAAGRGPGAADHSPLAAYPVAQERPVPNADAAHTPLMTPAITPEAAGVQPWRSVRPATDPVPTQPAFPAAMPQASAPTPVSPKNSAQPPPASARPTASPSTVPPASPPTGTTMPPPDEWTNAALPSPRESAQPAEVAEPAPADTGYEDRVTTPTEPFPATAEESGPDTAPAEPAEHTDAGTTVAQKVRLPETSETSRTVPHPRAVTEPEREIGTSHGEIAAGSVTEEAVTSPSPGDTPPAAAAQNPPTTTSGTPSRGNESLSRLMLHSLARRAAAFARRRNG